MKPLTSYDISDGEWIRYNSKLCSVACSIGYLDQYSELDLRIKELTQSFCNQWQFVIVTYDKLQRLFNDLNQHSDRSETSIITPYDIASTEKEVDFKSYSYLLIVSLKTYLDLFACLVDISLNQIIKEEHLLPDINSFGKKKNELSVNELKEEFEKLRNGNEYPWLTNLKNVRNLIVHRGYTLKPKFDFNKADNLTIEIYKGTNFNDNPLIINISDLFNDFMETMPLIEDKVSSILIDHIVSLDKKLLVNFFYRYGGLINEYNYEELEPYD